MSAAKAELRKRMEQARGALTADERAERSALACSAAIRLLERKVPCDAARPFTLFAYMPFRTELDVTPIIEWGWSRGAAVVVPKVIRERKLMSLHAIRSFRDLEAGAWGIREPKMDAPAHEGDGSIDAMLVPGLAFDERGGRLGYGGGYYDAFVRRYRDNFGRVPFMLAVAFDVQIVPEVPMDGHDFRVDAVVTESRTFERPS